MESITMLIQQAAEGRDGARDRLFATAYGELRKLARSRLRHGGRNTFLDTSALVHESYLKFLGAGQLRAEDRRAFFAYASRVMRSIIIDAVRERRADRHGGAMQLLTLDTQALDGLAADESDVLKVHEALDVLEAAEPRLAQVVEMRYFGGYTEAEIAEALEVTERTVRRDWNKAKMLLQAIMQA